MIMRVLVGGAIMRDGKILLLKRTLAKKFLPGYWDMPGGKIEPGEEPDAAIIRELLEETGLAVQITWPYNAWSSVIDFNGEKEQCVEIDYLIRISAWGEIRLSEKEHSEYGWFDRFSLPAELTPELRKTILKAFEARL